MGNMWGLVIALVGGLLVFWGRTRSSFLVYRLLAARSRLLWGDRVHGFYQVAGALMILVGVLIAITA